MMFLKKNLLPIGILILSFLIAHANSEVVCSEDELVKELVEDIEDNGKLDCLRESVGPKDETQEQRDKRLAANWDSDCSFESNTEGNHWKNRLIKNYGLTKGLVDVDGSPVENDFPDQADMCEIIRALLANNVFPNVGSDITSISKDVVQYIDCPGDDGQTEVCAANPGSFGDSRSWYIFLDGQSIRINDKPKYELSKDASNSQGETNY